MEFLPLVIFFAEIITLFFLSRKISQTFSALFFKFTRSEKGMIYLLSFLFLPGTIIHELSHFLMAKILLVPVSGMEFKPYLTDDETQLKLGSVQIAKVDLIRLLLIGAAPFLIGMLIILGSLFYFFNNPQFFDQVKWWVYALIIFIYFEIGNTMFSSKKDLEGSLALVGLIALIVSSLFIFQLYEPLIFLQNLLISNLVISIFWAIDKLLFVPILIDLLLIFIVSLPQIFLKRTIRV